MSLNASYTAVGIVRIIVFRSDYIVDGGISFLFMYNYNHHFVIMSHCARPSSIIPYLSVFLLYRTGSFSFSLLRI